MKNTKKKKHGKHRKRELRVETPRPMFTAAPGSMFIATGIMVSLAILFMVCVVVTQHKPAFQGDPNQLAIPTWVLLQHGIPISR